MSKPKPVEIDPKYGLVFGIVILLTAVIGTISKWKEFYDLFIPNGNFSSWRFFLLVLIITSVTIWFIMNHIWRKEYDEHEITKKERDNLQDMLKISENERLTDVITGVPNSRSLQKDIDERYSQMREGKKLQFILIDIKNFRKINNKYGFNKTNDLLRAIAQNIYRRMRRNEDMYKYSINDKMSNLEGESFYRVYPGGDEFAFIIEGDQADAIGFANRLVTQFKELSQLTEKIIGELQNLSFHCAIVEIDSRDTFTDIFKKAEDCYLISKSGNAEFTICWHPISEEKKLSADQRKKADYDKSKTIFEVKTIVEKDYL